MLPSSLTPINPTVNPVSTSTTAFYADFDLIASSVAKEEVCLGGRIQGLLNHFHNTTLKTCIRHDWWVTPQIWNAVCQKIMMIIIWIITTIIHLYFQRKKIVLKHEYSILSILFSTEKKKKVKWCIYRIEKDKRPSSYTCQLGRFSKRLARIEMCDKQASNMTKSRHKFRILFIFIHRITTWNQMVFVIYRLQTQQVVGSSCTYTYKGCDLQW